MKQIETPPDPTSILDPLLAHAPLPLRRQFNPLGFRVEIQTNTDWVLGAAGQSWPTGEPHFEEPPLRMLIGVHGEHSSTPTEAPVFRSRGHLLLITAGIEDFVVCDLASGFAFGWVRPSTAADIPFFRYHFLEAAVLCMLEQLYLAPVHGAVVVRSRKGVLLCGESCAGKSTLAYACARLGWTLVSDDATYFLRDHPELIALGNSRLLRFRPDAPRFFPELSGLAVSIRPNGKPGIEVLTKSLRGIETASGSTIDHIVFLDRADRGGASLSRVSRSEALAQFTNCAFYGREDVRTAQGMVYDRLSRLPLWRLRYSALGDAVCRLDQLVNCGA